MFTRILTHYNNSFFLFGPRGTGKSTWLKEHYGKAIFYDLLNTSEALRLSRQPSLLYAEVASLKAQDWVVIDEVQKVPGILDEIHRLIENKKIRFVLSGSSARKLRKGASNLLAGRAIELHLYPLVSAEIGFQFDLYSVLQFGTLPLALTGTNKQDYLRTYGETYLKEEIKEEALTRNIGSFGRFLEIAARQNGQVTNVAGTSRDAEVARQTVQGYFEILKDTLIGDWLPAWKLKRATRQVVHPKFYLFDPGVARALSNRLPYPPTPEELGVLLETFILGELQAYMSYHKLYYPLFFWHSQGSVEVDFFFETKGGFLAIECKSSKKWDKKFNKGLSRIQDTLGKTKVKTIGIYTGERQASWNNITVLPVHDFLKMLWAGELFL